MKKNVVRINEQALRKIISETVKDVLSEGTGRNSDGALYYQWSSPERKEKAMSKGLMPGFTRPDDSGEFFNTEHENERKKSRYPYDGETDEYKATLLITDAFNDVCDRYGDQVFRKVLGMIVNAVKDKPASAYESAIMSLTDSLNGEDV